MREYRAERRAKMTDVQREARNRSQRAYTERHPDRVKAAQARWRASAKAVGYHKKWHERNPEKARQYYLKKHYGITPEEYIEMLDAQNGCCAICLEEPPEGEFLRVDHCHRAGDRRGLLCHNCNVALGHLKDDPWRVVRAAIYLLRSRKADALVKSMERIGQRLKDTLYSS